MKSRCLPDWDGTVDKLLEGFANFKEKCDKAKVGLLRTMTEPPKWLLRRWLDWRQWHQDVVEEGVVQKWLKSFKIRDLVAVPVDKLNRELMLM